MPAAPRGEAGQDEPGASDHEGDAAAEAFEGVGDVAEVAGGLLDGDEVDLVHQLREGVAFDADAEMAWVVVGDDGQGHGAVDLAEAADQLGAGGGAVIGCGAEQHGVDPGGLGDLGHLDGLGRGEGVGAHGAHDDGDAAIGDPDGGFGHRLALRDGEERGLAVVGGDGEAGGALGDVPSEDGGEGGEVERAVGGEGGDGHGEKAFDPSPRRHVRLLDQWGAI